MSPDVAFWPSRTKKKVEETRNYLVISVALGGFHRFKRKHDINFNFEFELNLNFILNEVFITVHIHLDAIPIHPSVGGEYRDSHILTNM